MLDTLALAQIDEQRLQRVILDRFQDDPIGYRHRMLGVNSTRQQDEVSMSVSSHKKTLVQAAHGVGKTHLVAGLVQWYYDCFEPSITLTTAPNWTSVVELLWAELSDQRRHSRLDMKEMCAFWNGTPTALRRSDLHYAKGHNARTGEGFQGRHDERLLIAIDEGPGVEEHIWIAANSMLQSDLTRLIAIGNPTVTSGSYYDAARDPTFNVIRMSALDHPNIQAELIGLPPPIPKAVRLSWVIEHIEKNAVMVSTPDASCFEFPPGSGNWYQPNDEFRSRVLGMFPKQASNAIWDEAVIEHSRTTQLKQPDNIAPEIGCDVARFGDDLSTIYSRVGPCVLGATRHSQRDTIAVAKLCIEEAGRLARIFGVDRKSIRIKVDDSGVGGGTTDYLNEREYNVCPINSASTAIEEERYPNKRSELWFVTQERAHERRLDLTRLDETSYQILKKQLLQPTYKLDGHDRRLVEPKADTKKRLKASPDDADGFNLSFAGYDKYRPAMIQPVNIPHITTWPADMGAYAS